MKRKELLMRTDSKSASNLFLGREVIKMDLNDLIEQVACELYTKNGKVEGRDLENWLEAEWIVKNRYKSAADLVDFPEVN